MRANSPQARRYATARLNAASACDTPGDDLNPCFSPPMSMSPPLLSMYRASAANRTKPTTIFHISVFPIKKAPAGMTGACANSDQKIVKAGGTAQVTAVMTVLVVGVNINVFGFPDEQGSDHKCDAGNDDGVPQAVVHVAGLRHDGKGGCWQQATEPAITNVIRQAH